MSLHGISAVRKVLQMTLMGIQVVISFYSTWLHLIIPYDYKPYVVEILGLITDYILGADI